MASVKFLKGTLAGYQAITNPSANSIYITTDEGGIYLGSKRLGDYIRVADINALKASTLKSVDALYYAEAENVLARWDGSNWVQINAAGLTEVSVSGSGDYISNVSVSTNANGTARALQVTKASLDSHTTIADHEKRLGDAEALLNALSGGDGSGSISDMITEALAPVEAKADKAQETADGAVATNVTQQASIDDHETRIGDLEEDLAQEVTDRQNAISGLVNGASAGYTTLKDLETKIKAADSKAQGAVDVNTTQQSEIDDLESRMGTAESNIAQEVTDRQAAITGLIGDAAADYNTLGKLEDKIIEAKKAADNAQADANTNAGAISDLEGRVAENESDIGVLEATVTKLNAGETTEGSVAYQIAQVVNNAPENFDTLKEIADWISNDQTGAANLASRITTLESTVNTDHANRIDTLEGDVADLEGALAQEVTDRQNAITGLVNGASNGYETLKDIETAVKAVASTANTNAGDISALEGRVSTNEGNIGNLQSAVNTLNGADTVAGSVKKQVKDLKNELIGDATTYTTFGEVEDELTRAAGVADQAATDLTALEGRVGTNETNIANEVTNRKQAITDLINGASADYNTLKKLETKIIEAKGVADGAVSVNNTQNTTLNDHENRIGALESQLEWGSF